ncbi:MAG: hypothetical protein KZQ64_09360 [gamma proteobacterium symbiont of Bathyaustriella thionipta]|nr:hypothetical protein [gamma proteobacterium symbiont of Bathyaustriella thionipta]MCU7949471.1 hypothetical protein [gamma proteobacterium symbiont of Bathyaustriella thionipta]MCU7953581.1 hypothetical protein [gamma proteobacterium symbiont of Bathyaustriella thionipta]MCU7955937.1 hypothetical protein [gamma proteobacterium symbiont of Bathyaustriella thionipta]MCU7968554.1 hypothetical protein [gamma proteobacterium symbiont of Bathyaustriella thionipta]
MSQFNPCQGKMACRDDGKRCLTCGRSFHEINQLRDLMSQLTALAIDYDYENINEYSTYIAQKLEQSIAYHQQQAKDIKT